MKGTLVMTRLFAFLALAVTAAGAMAQAPFPAPPPPSMAGAYVGATIGYVQAKSGCVGVLAGGGRSCDDKDPAFGAFGGYRLNRYFGAELGVRYLGKVRASGPGSSADIQTMVADLTALGIVPIEDRFAAYVRFGGYYAMQKASVAGVSDENSTDLTFGGGLQWDFAGGLGLRAEWQRYKKVGKDKPAYSVSDYDVLGVAALWRFH